MQKSTTSLYLIGSRVNDFTPGQVTYITLKRQSLKTMQSGILHLHEAGISWQLCLCCGLSCGRKWDCCQWKENTYLDNDKANLFHILSPTPFFPSLVGSCTSSDWPYIANLLPQPPRCYRHVPPCPTSLLFQVIYVYCKKLEGWKIKLCIKTSYFGNIRNFTIPPQESCSDT